MPEKERRTFRVRQIPAYIKEGDLPKLLKGLTGYVGPTDQIEVFSLASSVDVYESPPAKVATVKFEYTPAAFLADSDEWIFHREKTFLPYNVIIDTHFRGFTVLNDVTSGNHKLEYLQRKALHGHSLTV